MMERLEIRYFRETSGIDHWVKSFIRELVQLCTEQEQ